MSKEAENKPLQQPLISGSLPCGCLKCSPNVFPKIRFNVCPICRNKRCPHASDHNYECTNSNDVGQTGSVYGGNDAKPMLADAVFRPMLFSTPMVQAILKDKKTQTRRIIKLRDKSIPDETSISYGIDFDKDGEMIQGKPDKVMDFSKTFPYWQEQKSKFNIGDIIWCRETFAVKGNRIFYRADNDSFENAGLKGLYDFVWKPSLFMPKDVCRLFLQITDIRIEQLQAISEDDAIAEGLEKSIVKSKIFQTYLGYKNYYVQDAEDELFYRSPIDSYRSLWMSINGSKSWQENPFVWVYTFKVVECPYGFR